MRHARLCVKSAFRIVPLCCLVQGLTNKDGSAKTECGIHVAGEDEDSGMSNIRK